MLTSGVVCGGTWRMRVDGACMVHACGWCLRCMAHACGGGAVYGWYTAVVRDGDGRWVVVRVLRKGFKMGSQQGTEARQ